MNSQSKAVGESGCQIVTGVGPHAVKTGYGAYAALSWVDATQIKSITPCEDDGTTKTAVTNETWESEALSDGRLVNFADPVAGYELIKSVTLNAAGDKLQLWLKPLAK